MAISVISNYLQEKPKKENTYNAIKKYAASIYKRFIFIHEVLVKVPVIDRSVSE
jgi:hypothetical protein